MRSIKNVVALRRPLVHLFACCMLLLSSAALQADEPFRVVASIKPIHSILSSLMEGVEGPELLVGKGAIPFGYQLTEAQQAGLKTAAIVVWAGPELESFLVEPLRSVSAQTEVVTLLDSYKVKVLSSRWNDELRDPFFWLDTRNVIILVDELAKILMRADAPRAHLYERNRAKLMAKISELDRRLEYGYRGMKSGVGMAYYDTLQYFEQAYALKIRGVVAQSPLQSVDTALLLGSRAKLAEGIYTCLLTENRMAMPELPLLLGDIKVNQGQLDSFGSTLEPGPQLYFDLMNHNTDTIKACLQHEATTAAPPAGEGTISSNAKIGGKFMLVDHHGKLFTEKDLLGSYQMIYFGYTFCPDICPSALQVMSLSLDMLGEKADKIKPYFITVDPERDTVAVMKNYVGYFNERLIGLTGSKSMTDRVAEQYRVRYEKVLEEGMDPDMYIMDHTASVYLIAPDGTFITKLAHGISAADMVKKINEYIR